MKRIPIFATLVVAAAVATMIWLGFWQLDRLKQKEALLAKFAAAQAMSSDAIVAPAPPSVDDVLYRHTTLRCGSVGNWRAIAGHNAKGQTGFAHLAECRVDLSSSPDNLRVQLVDVALGWSREPKTPGWPGGVVRGLVAPQGKGFKVIADQPVPGLEPLARPDPRDTPNNHFAYAVQWFLFAGVAAAVYGLALRKRLAGGDPPR